MANTVLDKVFVAPKAYYNINSVEMPSNKELCIMFNITKAELKATRLNNGYLVQYVRSHEIYHTMEKGKKVKRSRTKWETFEVLDNNKKPIYIGLPLVKKTSDNIYHKNTKVGS